MIESKSVQGMFFKSFLLIMMGLSLWAKKSPIDVQALVQGNIKTATIVEKKMLVLSKKEAALLAQKAKTKLEGTIYRSYLAKHADKVVGYACLISKKVRTKKATVLYIFDVDVKLKAIEILSFLEPHEYKPSPSWLSLFFSSDVPVVMTGATMSARMVEEGVAVAKALVEMKLR